MFFDSSSNSRDITAIRARSPQSPSIDLVELPETERFVVELTKDVNGLGITIAGYVCEKEELSGIFVKSISAGSAADLSGKIQVNDRIIEVDQQSLQGFSNHQAVEVLKKSGTVVSLCLERYLRGPKYEQLQQAIAANETKPSTPSIPPEAAISRPHSGMSITNRMQPPIRKTSLNDPYSQQQLHDHYNHTNVEKVNPQPKAAPPVAVVSGTVSNRKLTQTRDSLENKVLKSKDEIDSEDSEHTKMSNMQTLNVALLEKHKYWVEPMLTKETELLIKSRWEKILNSESTIIVAQIRKFAASSGLGISLEGTVDVEGGMEVRPHHYIRSILPEGPVGKNGLLRSGDELLGNF